MLGDTARKLQSWDSNPGTVTPDHAPDPGHFITPSFCIQSVSVPFMCETHVSVGGKRGRLPTWL